MHRGLFFAVLMAGGLLAGCRWGYEFQDLPDAGDAGDAGITNDTGDAGDLGDGPDAGECVRDEECPGGGPCAAGRCRNGVCELDPLDGLDCDDGVYCNGDDNCLDGTCSWHAGDPCAGLGCTESERSCRTVDWGGLDDSDLGSWEVRLEGSSWGGGVSASAGSSREPSLALDSAGRPVVAWSQNPDGQFKIYLKRFDGTRFVGLAGSDTNPGICSPGDYSQSPSLVLDTADRPVVAWSNGGGSASQIFVKRYDGTGWVDVGEQSSSGEGVSQSTGMAVTPSLALDGTRNPVVAWSDNSAGNWEIRVKRFDGVDWVELGAGSAYFAGISSNSGTSQTPVLWGGDSPVVAWADDFSGSFQIYLKRFTAGDWIELDGSATGAGVSASPESANEPGLVLDPTGQPVVSWTESQGGIREIHLKRFDGAAWVDVGSGSAGGSNGMGNSLAQGPDGNLWVAWSEWTGGNGEIYLKRFDGSNWGEWPAGSASGGGLSHNAGTSRAPSLAVKPDGAPVVAWQDETPLMDEIYLKAFGLDSLAWEDLGPGSVPSGGISGTPGSSTAPSLTLDSSGEAMVFWQDSTPGNWTIYARSNAGGGWNEVGAGSTSGAGIGVALANSYSPVHDRDENGHLVVAWTQEVSLNRAVYVKQFLGDAWVEVGSGSAAGFGIGAADENGTSPSIRLDRQGRPVVAWENGFGTSQIFVKGFDGSEWVEIGAGSASGGGISQSGFTAKAPSLVLDGNDRPVVAWADMGNEGTQIYVRRFDGSSWVEAGEGAASGSGVSGTEGSSINPDLVIDSAGRLLVAWMEQMEPGDQIYLRRLEDNDWVELGTGSATGGGVSDTEGISVFPALALDSRDQPVVAWTEYTSADLEIFVKWFNGDRWVELGPGAASGGGISNSSGRSSGPVVHANGGRICVAWQEAGPSAAEIVMRCVQE